MTDLAKWKGFGSLIVDAVEQGSRAVERIQLETAERPFAILEQVPVVAAVHALHTAAVTTIHAAVRLGARAVGTVIEVALSTAEGDR